VDPNLTDHELVELARTHLGQGDEAFRTLYERYKDELFAFTLRVTRNRALAEDAFQDAFVRVFQNLERYDPTRAFRPWLYRIARNAAIDRLRREGKTAPLERELPGEDRVAREASRHEDEARTRAALTKLDPDVRALLVQRHSQGLKLAELAEVWACTERTVRNRLRRAAGELAAVLAEGGVA